MPHYKMGFLIAALRLLVLSPVGAWTSEICGPLQLEHGTVEGWPCKYGPSPDPDPAYCRYMSCDDGYELCDSDTGPCLCGGVPCTGDDILQRFCDGNVWATKVGPRPLLCRGAQQYRLG